MSVIRIGGEVDIYTAPELKSLVDQVIDSGAKELVIDMADVTYMDSSGFGTRSVLPSACVPKAAA